MENVRRKSRNNKTSMTDERPHSNHQERMLPKDVCKSINIFPIKIQNANLAIQKQRNFNETLKNLDSNTTTSLKANKQNIRRTLLSIKSKPSLKIENADEFRNLLQSKDQIITEKHIASRNKKRSSISFSNSTEAIPHDEDSDKFFEILHRKKDIMMLDHSRLVIEATMFKTLLKDFSFQIKQIKTDRDTLQQKVNKYEHYFKEMRLKHIPTLAEEQSVQKNQQLKILNLQKKVQTLNYIIKQYRTNNSQQIKNFQQKLKDFKPNIQKQLTEKLAETNQKYERLLQKVQFFQKECKSKLKLNWQDLMAEFEQTKGQNQKNIKVINQLSDKLKELSTLMRSSQAKIQNCQRLEEEVIDQKEKIQKLNDLKLELQEAIQQKDKKIDELSHIYEQTSFKLEGLKNLQFRIQNKDKTIKKNTVVINRLQCQNIELKTKVDTVLGQFQSRIFCQKSLQQSLLKANSTINDLTNRLHETFVDFCESSSQSIESTKQKQHFIGHLFEKVKGSYNQIISQYQSQLKLMNSQCDNWKETFNMISKSQEQKFKYIQKTQFDLMRIQEKKLRCQDLYQKVSSFALDQCSQKGKSCESCKYLVTYWGQLENSYSQIKTILQKVMKLQSINQVTSKNPDDSVPSEQKDFSSNKTICVLSISCI